MSDERPDDGEETANGVGGAEEGISPLSSEAYDDDPEGPTTSTED